MARGQNLRLVKTKVDGADDADPRTTPPAEADIWKPGTRSEASLGSPTRGFFAKLHMDAGDTCTVEIYVRNLTAADTVESWALAGTITGVATDVMIVQDDLGDAEVYFRLTTLTSGAEPVEVWSEELA